MGMDNRPRKVFTGPEGKAENGQEDDEDLTGLRFGMDNEATNDTLLDSLEKALKKSKR